MDALGFTIQKNKDGSYFLIRRKFNQKFGPYKVKSPAELQPIIKKLRYEGVSSDSVDDISEKYGHEVRQNDVAAIDPYDYNHTIFQICVLNAKIKELSKMESYKREMASLIKKVEAVVAKMTPEQKKTLRMIKDNYKNSDFKIKGL